ncbi:hypothetical protein NMY22_g18204 [Coprinellus aureogranulatus]|nr:hypothetical protein NMY22_g18204 [Coprinellus aureogranulatus]
MSLLPAPKFSYGDAIDYNDMYQYDDPPGSGNTAGWADFWLVGIIAGPPVWKDHPRIDGTFLSGWWYPVVHQQRFKPWWKHGLRLGPNAIHESFLRHMTRETWTSHTGPW